MDARLLESAAPSQPRREHSPLARPPDKEAPARVGSSAGAESMLLGNGPAKYKTDAFAPQAPPVISFSEIVRKSTPTELLTMVRLHRLYMPSERLPAELQRALGCSWMHTGAPR